MIRRWRRSLAGQFVAFICFSLIVSQGLAYIISWDERGRAVAAEAKAEFFTRSAALHRLLTSLPPDLRQETLTASETARSRFWLDIAGPGDADDWRARAGAELSRPLSNLVHLSHYPADLPPPLSLEDIDQFASANAGEHWADPASATWELPGSARFIFLGGKNGFGLTMELPDGVWLNAAYFPVRQAAFLSQRTAVALVLSAALLLILGLWAAHRLARPLRRLAHAAEAVGRGEEVPPLPEEGAEDLRETTAAFNKMQVRLMRFLSDRAQLLAALGHDLRTPLTSLRLRAEFVADPELQARLLGTVDEIQTMAEATIDLARGGETGEETRTVDLSALIGSLCDDLSEIGQEVSFEGAGRLLLRCRPTSIRRALRNVIENAGRYGTNPRLHLLRDGMSVRIEVLDDGPGIAEEMLEQVFAPFFRLETSRCRSTGGLGLGLAIARTIIRHHGGDITLQNRHPGLCATITLPLTPAMLPERPHPAPQRAAYRQQGKRQELKPS